VCFVWSVPHAHSGWTRLRVNRPELGWWSFLMSSAHGAGLMVAPVLIGAGAAEASASSHDTVEHVSAALSAPVAGGLMLLLHVASMMVVMGIVAVVVYEKLGVAILRQA